MNVLILHASPADAQKPGIINLDKVIIVLNSTMPLSALTLSVPLDVGTTVVIFPNE